MKKRKTYSHQLNVTSKQAKTPKVSAEFMKRLDRVIAEHEDVLRELAKR